MCLVICGCSACCAGRADIPTNIPQFILAAPTDVDNAAVLLSAADKEV